MDEQLLNAVSNVGIPAAICFYTLVKVNATLAELTRAVTRLEKQLAVHFNVAA